tara:strand:- start:1275 stop:1508 length:234 start_codon:yes stop_codon:yes gene_type:complete
MLKKPNEQIFNDEERLITLNSIDIIASSLEDKGLESNRIYETAVKIYGIDQHNMLLDSILAQLEELVSIAEDLQDKE